MTGSLVSSVSSVRWGGGQVWTWWEKGRLFTSSGERVGRLIPRSSYHAPAGRFGLLGYLYGWQFELQDNAGACVGQLIGPPGPQRPYAYVLDAEGTEVASLAAELCAPSGRSESVYPVRYSVFINGAKVGSIDPTMSAILEKGDGLTGLFIERRWRSRINISRSEALPEHLVDTFTWFGLLPALCHRKRRTRPGG